MLLSWCIIIHWTNLEPAPGALRVHLGRLIRRLGFLFCFTRLSVVHRFLRIALLAPSRVVCFLAAGDAIIRDLLTTPADAPHSVSEQQNIWDIASFTAHKSSISFPNDQLKGGYA